MILDALWRWNFFCLKLAQNKKQILLQHIRTGKDQGTGQNLNFWHNGGFPKKKVFNVKNLHFGFEGDGLKLNLSNAK